VQGEGGTRSIGIIVPSANVVVERAAIRFAAEVPGLELQFTRIPVRGDADPFVQGYDVDAFLRAAELLADARPDVLLWAGSMGVLVGAEHDERLGELIEAETGLPFTSSTIALVRLAERERLERIALVTPYAQAYQDRLVAGFVRLGFDCVAEEHAGLRDNLSYAGIGEEDTVRMALKVSVSRPDAILSWCTNFASTGCVQRIEVETGLPFHDATLLGLSDAAQRIFTPALPVTELQ